MPGVSSVSFATLSLLGNSWEVLLIIEACCHCRLLTMMSLIYLYHQLKKTNIFLFPNDLASRVEF